ncbi:hypothetical protein C5167_009345 [Papaver somniferum]|uniref:Uncharacterized protein n=1 Tax=Papaver somniferum TaxID=3469 RepID=A0A4Y7K139_PAPSO|nr:uncharacterized protein LOC113285759 isoform X2 [Papaver somniferum]XP_026390325.1 uncharacterized protein LOC113285759 isoform X2 [Papaver somniferum]RZC65659.1 hypothetical protein C5167_009345 [Papaver somniferum]
MADFGAPTFSLGLDLDFDSEIPPQDNKLEAPYEPPPPDSIELSSQEEEVNIQQQTPIPDVEESRPVLKRLRRGGSSSNNQHKQESVFISSTVDDDIEDFSSQEDIPRDTRSAVQNHSVASTSKLALPARRPLPRQWMTNPKANKEIPSSKASTSKSLDASEKKVKFPLGPVRRFPILDSDFDSDDVSSGEDQHEDAPVVDSSSRKRQFSSTQPVAGQQKMAKSGKIEDLWKDFTTKISTPALDEFCEEYFKSAENSNVNQAKDKGVHLGTSRPFFQKVAIRETFNKDGQPPAYLYFYNDDPRIQRLVRERLPYFSPLAAKENHVDKESEVAAIDYMSQFGHKEAATPISGKGKKILEKTPKRSRKNAKKSNAKEAVQDSANWVNPKSSANIPKDAGKRRVQANNRATGHWYTNADGKKIYVNKNGQELSGQIAYRHHKKENCGFKKSRKKTSPKKKSKR